MEERQRSCVFCAIVDRKAPAAIRYEDEEIIVFDNILRWAPIMLLVAPKRHYTQEEFWGNGLLDKAGRIAVAMGREHCPQGFRLLANFGGHAMQSQEHGHIHVVGGRHLGPYILSY